MISVLGLPLQEACSRLEQENVRIVRQEVRSKKGTGGSDLRVIRQKELVGDAIELSYAAFITMPHEEA